MLQSFTVQGFRCFEGLALERLERVNLIAGRNNVGKTTLLEALLLFETPENPHVATIFNQTRGLKLTREDPRGWLLLHPSLRASAPMVLAAQTGSGPATLTVEFHGSTSFPLTDSADDEEPSEGRFEVALEYDGPRGKGVSRLRVDGGKLSTERASLSPAPPCLYYPSSRLPNRKDEARRFSDLERAGRQGELLEPLRLLEPRLKRLLLLLVGDESIVHADLGLDEPIPVPAMGEGTGRLLALLLGILAARGGVVLIDEVENGIHYSALVDVWKAIAAAARSADVQVFATTHSWECIVAAQRAFTESEPYDFRLQRLDREGGSIRALSYDEEVLDAALTSGLEVR
jgi:AAA domain, putative AbiEii toxin, Type IV TA system/AAA ATPase domain